MDKIVNGEVVTLSKEEEAAMQAEWQAAATAPKEEPIVADIGSLAVALAALQTRVDALEKEVPKNQDGEGIKP